MTEKGRRQARLVCLKAKELGTQVDVVVSSPLVRARETATIAREVLNPQAELKVDSCLGPESLVKRVYDYLSKVELADRIVLVTHGPLLGALVRDLLDWHVERKNLRMNLGAMIRIDCDNAPGACSGNLVWLLPQLTD